MRQPCWSENESKRVQALYEEGDKSCLPWPVIRDRLNKEFGNNRSLVSCQLRLYKMAKMAKRPKQGGPTTASGVGYAGGVGSTKNGGER